MNAALLVSHWSLTRNVQDFVRSRLSAESQDLLKREAGLLSIERAQLSLQVGALSELGSTLRAMQSKSGAPVPAQPPQPEHYEEVQRMLEVEGPGEKPDPFNIPPLTDDEKHALEEAARDLPPLTLSPLKLADLDQLLGDSAWNPRGRQLSPEDREKAMKLIQDNHFFSFTSLVKRFKTLMEPELPRMQELGAYVEYDPTEGELPFDGFTINHTEIFAKNRHRMYYFPQSQYPDLYLHRQVCQEQAQKTLVELHWLILGE
jgi:hypothetical protein